jgi:hypothetical protein
MIFIIGTRHSLQYWSDAIRNGEDCDADPVTVQQFEDFLQHAAITLDATIIAEELSQESVEERQGGVSVARQVAKRLGLCHLYCDPDRAEREALSVSAGHEREDFWASRIQLLLPNDTRAIFVCGADHSRSFAWKLEGRGLIAQVYCADWTLTPGQGWGKIGGVTDS